MALDLNEYIKQSYERPNRKILEGLGASEDLIEYLMETPGNTNWNMLESLNGNNEKYSGIKSVIISPTIEMNPTLETLFPIYYEGENIQENTHITTNTPLASDYVVTVVPSDDWYALVGDGNYGGASVMGDEKGKAVELTISSNHDMLNIVIGAYNELPTSEPPEKYIINAIQIVYEEK